MVIYFIERYGLMVIKILFKFEFRRFCRATNARGLVKFDCLEVDEFGFVFSIEV